MCITVSVINSLLSAVYYSAPDGERSIVMSVCVCVCVCACVRARACVRACVCVSVRDYSFGTTRPIFTKCLAMLPMPVARSSSGDVVICLCTCSFMVTSYLLIS